MKLSVSKFCDFFMCIQLNSATIVKVLQMSFYSCDMLDQQNHVSVIISNT